ncbi:hypothetical protein [[Mycoplasma] testudinis]|uniref:hypothetical protein n=1 Tax=[Mycoplasma] testudinis TaxID=33924 RepID=UPI0004824ADC|nr:hypothetical protein [[Mycoplasma] testudinis]
MKNKKGRKRIWLALISFSILPIGAIAVACGNQKIDPQPSDSTTQTPANNQIDSFWTDFKFGSSLLNPNQNNSNTTLLSPTRDNPSTQNPGSTPTSPENPNPSSPTTITPTSPPAPEKPQPENPSSPSQPPTPDKPSNPPVTPPAPEKPQPENPSSPSQPPTPDKPSNPPVTPPIPETPSSPSQPPAADKPSNPPVTPPTTPNPPKPEVPVFVPSAKSLNVDQSKWNLKTNNPDSESKKIFNIIAPQYTSRTAGIIGAGLLTQIYNGLHNNNPAQIDGFNFNDFLLVMYQIKELTDVYNNLGTYVQNLVPDNRTVDLSQISKDAIFGQSIFYNKTNNSYTVITTWTAKLNNKDFVYTRTTVYSDYVWISDARFTWKSNTNQSVSYDGKQLNSSSQTASGNNFYGDFIRLQQPGTNVFYIFKLNPLPGQNNFTLDVNPDVARLLN